MASLGFHQGCMIQKEANYGYLNQQPVRVSGSTHLTVKLPNNKLSSSFNMAALTCDSGARSNLSLFNRGFDIQTERIHNNDIESPRVSENLDEWIQSSVTDIVKNITHAPLLVQIYADGNVTTKKSREAKNWWNVINVNKHKTSSSLEGVVLVEELPADKCDGDRAYGVLIQRKIKSRNECKSSCYLLKTSSVNGEGLGHVCTHFCLMKVQSFHKNAFQQFSDSWLVQ